MEVIMSKRLLAAGFAAILTLNCPNKLQAGPISWIRGLFSYAKVENQEDKFNKEARKINQEIMFCGKKVENLQSMVNDKSMEQLTALENILSNLALTQKKNRQH